MNIIGKWNEWYKNLPKKPTTGLYGDIPTYALGAEFLKDCKVVEDWGTGTGAFKLHREDAIGIDGSNTPQADKKADLTQYVSSCDGIFIRHVLEHNLDWEKILKNALKSAGKVCVVLFTPLNKKGTIELPEISFQNRKYGVDVLTFSLGIDQIDKILKECSVKQDSYKNETIFYITRGKDEA